jgi:replicative DNA helicase
MDNFEHDLEDLMRHGEKPTSESEPLTARIYDGKESLEEYERLNERYGQGLKTGFALLDQYFTLIPQQLYLVSAPTHQGKTIFSLNIAGRVASTGKKVLFVSLEQGVFISQFVENIIGEYPETLSILDSSDRLTIQDLLDLIVSHKERFDLIIIDHIHFFKKNGRGVTEDIDEIILEIQNLAKKLEVPIITIAHVRKLNSDRPPDLDDLRDSSSLSQVPSVVMFLYRKKNEKAEEGYLSDEGILMIPKNRIQGKTGMINFRLAENKRFVFNNVDDWIDKEIEEISS